MIHSLRQKSPSLASPNLGLSFVTSAAFRQCFAFVFALNTISPWRLFRLGTFFAWSAISQDGLPGSHEPDDYSRDLESERRTISDIQANNAYLQLRILTLETEVKSKGDAAAAASLETTKALAIASQHNDQQESVIAGLREQLASREAELKTATTKAQRKVARYYKKRKIAMSLEDKAVLQSCEQDAT